MLLPVTPITDEEIQVIAQNSDLKPLDSERLDFLKNLGPVDVSACPGSGKTTLIIMKLLLLMEKWESTSQGICVLSHTNVAKNEVSTRLERTGINHNLNGKPHFVGTIHGFINQFITYQYLFSMGYPPQQINTNLAYEWRCKKISHQTRVYLEQHHIELKDIKIESINENSPFGDKLIDKKNAPGKHTLTDQEIAKVFWQSIRNGIITDDEILFFAKIALEICPEIIQSIRYRFPFVITDETQDCSSAQMELLNHLFDSGADKKSKSVIQRVGDPNQAIYSSSEKINFPNKDSITIANSHRLNGKIATIATSLAVSGIEGGLKGINDSNPQNPLHFILFDDQNIEKVLPTFADIVSSNIPPDVISNNKVAAIGDRIRGENEEKRPYSLRDYYPPFSADKQTRDFKHFYDYVVHAQLSIKESGMLSDGVEILADGFTRIISNDKFAIKTSARRKYQNLIQTLHDNKIDAGEIKNLFSRILLEKSTSKITYFDLLLNITKDIVLPGSNHDQEIEKIKNFYAIPKENIHRSPYPPTNVFQHNGVKIELSSIHAIKGETHAATLLLDTFNRMYFVKRIIPFLLGHKIPKRTTDKHKRAICGSFVAFTRPTHLLAVAAPESHLKENEISKLEERGWTIDTSLCEPWDEFGMESWLL